MIRAMPQGPLAPDVYDPARPVPSWWEASAPPDRARPALSGDVMADVAIIGAGYAGIAAARALAEAGLSAVALDAGAIGWGASGRNGGIAGPGGHKLPEAALLRRHGAEEVARHYRALAGTLRDLRAFAEGVPGLADQVQGDGELVFAHSPKMAAAMAREAAPPGFEVEHLGAMATAGVASRGAVLVRPAFGIHPLLLVRALADRAEAAGAAIHPASPVIEWAQEGRAHRLMTPGGSVRADAVLVATNGFTPDGLGPAAGGRAVAGRAVPVISNIAVTRVLTAEERARHQWLGPNPMADSRHMLCYFRLLPEGRILFGMRGDLTGAEANTGAMREAVRTRMVRELPGLGDLEIDFFWRGPVCMTGRLTPSVGWVDRERRVACAFGWHGSGIGMANLGGRLAGELLAGAPEDAIPGPMRGLAPRLPLPGLRPVYVGLGSSLLRLIDRIT